MYVFGMPMKDWQQAMMGKSTTVTDRKLCGERIQIKEIHVLLPFV